MAPTTAHFEIAPVDTLFFRDARPMQAGAGSGGHGARWPLPTVVHEALRAALLARSEGGLPQVKELPGHRHPGTPGDRRIASRDFESLRILGVLPSRNGKLVFPVPADVAVVGTTRGDGDTADCPVRVAAPLLRPPGSSNFPAPWLGPVGLRAAPTKESPPLWLTAASLKAVLAAAPGETVKVVRETPLWETEHRIGVEIDPNTRAAREGQLYSSEHMRLREGVSIWFAASVSPVGVATDRQAELSALAAMANGHLLLGGESRMARVEASSDLLGEPTRWRPELKEFADPNSNVERLFGVKWVLVTPAVFLAGWRPNWVHQDSGAVLLPRGDTRRRDGEDRATWRSRIRRMAEQPIRAKLVAVCAPKPIAFSGWEIAAANESGGRGAPKPTLLAVPAGSVYYFAVSGREDADHLMRALHGRTRSDRLGEKGMGLGFCGTWTALSLETN